MGVNESGISSDDVGGQQFAGFGAPTETDVSGYPRYQGKYELKIVAIASPSLASAAALEAAQASGRSSAFSSAVAVSSSASAFSAAAAAAVDAFTSTESDSPRDKVQDGSVLDDQKSDTRSSSPQQRSPTDELSQQQPISSQPSST